MTPDSLAIIHLLKTDPPMFRAAAFVFETAEGITWVEPSYADPLGSSRPSQHSIAGTIEDNADGGFQVVDGGQVVARVAELGVDAPDDPQRSCTNSLLNFADYLVEKDTTVDAERQAVAIQAGISAS